MWSLKHRPEKLGEFVGNSTLIEKLKARDWGTPVLLSGAPGVGKTVLCSALAGDFGWELMEVTQDNLDDALLVSQSASLFGGRRLLVLDNVERFRDMKRVVELLKVSRNPVVLVTTDAGNRKLSTVKRLCELMSLRRMHPATLAKYLNKVCDTEGVKAEEKVLSTLAKNAQGDVRSALNDLETLAKGRVELKEADVGAVSARDKLGDLYGMLETVYYTRNIRESAESTRDLNEQPRDILLWIEENLPHAYAERNSLAEALASLSRADVFLGRIMRRQYWGFLRYVTPLMTAGVSVARPEKVSRVRFQFPSFFAALGRTKKERNLREGIGVKLRASGLFHGSNRRLAESVIPVLVMMLQRKLIDASEFQNKIRLEDEELAYLLG